MIYNPNNWYWLADDGRLYSSSIGQLLPTNNEAFEEWLSLGGLPTPWPRDDEGNQTEDALQAVLSQHGLYFDLGRLKVSLKVQVDAAAEAERLKYITPGDGQAMTYRQKVDEALAFKAADIPLAEDYLLLASEVGITAPTLGEVADTVLAAYSHWQLMGAAIETARLGAKRDIDAAADEAAARAIVDAIEWPQPAL